MGTYAGRLVQTIRLNYASQNVSTGSYVAITATAFTTGTSLREDAGHVEIFDSSGGEMVLAYGAAGGEQTAYRVPPGGSTGPIPMLLNKGMRLALKCADASTPATVSSGVFIMNLFV